MWLDRSGTFRQCKWKGHLHQLSLEHGFGIDKCRVQTGQKLLNVVIHNFRPSAQNLLRYSPLCALFENYNGCPHPKILHSLKIYDDSIHVLHLMKVPSYQAFSGIFTSCRSGTDHSAIFVYRSFEFIFKCFKLALSAD